MQGLPAWTGKIIKQTIFLQVKASKPSRIINVSSIGHERIHESGIEDLNWETRPYDNVKAYRQSKLANVLYTQELARRLGDDSGVTAYSLHPGFVRSEISRHMDEQMGMLSTVLWPFLTLISKDCTDGAQTTIYCAVDEEVKDHNGLYYADCKVKKMNPIAEDKDLAKKLWEISEKLTGIKK